MEDSLENSTQEEVAPKPKPKKKAQPKACPFYYVGSNNGKTIRVGSLDVAERMVRMYGGVVLDNSLVPLDYDS